MGNINETNEQGRGTIVKIVYCLYIISLIFGGSTLFVALIVNLFMRDGANEIELSHFKFQMSLFLKALVLCVIGVLTIPIFIGVFILLGTYFWLLFKSIKGLDTINKSLPINEYYKK